MMQTASWTKSFEAFMETCGIHRESYASDQDFWFARSSFIFTNVGLVFAIFYLFLYFLTGAYAAGLAISGLALTLILTHPLHWWGKTRILALTNLAATSIGLAGVTLHLGGIQSSVACWLLGSAPGIAALLFRRVNEIVALTLLAVTLYTGIFVLQMKGYPVRQLPFPEGSFADAVFVFLTTLCYAIFIGTALSIFAISQKKLYETLQKTKEDSEASAENIKAMFHFMEQVMFTVDDTLRIVNQNAQQYERMIGSDVRNLEAFLQKTSLGPDRIDMVKQIVQACVREGEQSFEFNVPNLPSRLTYRKSPEANPQTLLLQWTPVMQGAQIREILLAVRDNTIAELEQAREEEIQTQNSFLLSALKLQPSTLRLTIRDMIEYERRLESAIGTEPINIRSLKSLIHTLKGNSRSFGLQHITERCHAIENRLADTHTSEEVTLPELLAKLRSDLKLFINTYRDNWATKIEESDRIDLGRRELSQLVQYLKQQSHRYNNLEALEAKLSQRMGHVFQILRAELPAIASELGKPTPLLVGHGEEILLCDEHVSSLIAVLGHLVRNSCDHGLEPAQERLAKGKSAEGQLTIGLEQGTEGFVLSMQDDGRGLPLEKIRARLSEENTLTDEQVAEYIFEPEFTTKDSVTAISGRGIGLLAAREELVSMGGSISLEFTASEHQGYRPFRFVLTLPLAAAIVQQQAV